MAETNKQTTGQTKPGSDSTLLPTKSLLLEVGLVAQGITVGQAKGLWKKRYGPFIAQNRPNRRLLLVCSTEHFKHDGFRNSRFPRFSLLALKAKDMCKCIGSHYFQLKLSLLRHWCSKTEWQECQREFHLLNN